MVPLPASIRVGPFVYGVDQEEAPLRAFEHEDGKGRKLGLTNNATLAIHLDPHMAAGQTRATLWHEVKHTIVHAVGGWPSECDEEEAVALVGQLELAALRDNPALVAFLLEPDDGG